MDNHILLMNTDSASLVLFRLVLRIQILMIPESDTENDTENDDDNNIYTHGDDDDTADADTGSLTLLIMILVSLSLIIDAVAPNYGKIQNRIFKFHALCDI